nr:polycystin-1-like [Salvelinus alpinus]
MHSRVLNEEPLVLRGTDIAPRENGPTPVTVLVHDDDSPECRRFSIPRAFNNSLSRAATSVVQLMFQVEPIRSPLTLWPTTQSVPRWPPWSSAARCGSQIPISDLDDKPSHHVAVNNGSATDSNGAGLTGVPLAGPLT